MMPRSIIAAVIKARAGRPLEATSQALTIDRSESVPFGDFNRHTLGRYGGEEE
ncbi:hypothetical protein ZHAS_00000620 [Anopheles sinensis]|uniref:Uncharacterized protein n=1 Tax=Anopheles sinensis TaxID=74873 RepID=A0A084VAE0_ANOSI|nr:hypothetical protein ZHAS_00000620 [Anopheles sinensis]